MKVFCKGFSSHARHPQWGWSVDKILSAL